MSERKRYTAQEMREEAEKLDELCRAFEKKSRTPAMLRQAADTEEELAKAKRQDACPANPTNKMCHLQGEHCCYTMRYLHEENAQLKALLDAVVKECENQMPEQMFIRMNDEASLQTKESVTAILRAARGDVGKETE